MLDDRKFLGFYLNKTCQPQGPRIKLNPFNTILYSRAFSFIVNEGKPLIQMDQACVTEFLKYQR